MSWFQNLIIVVVCFLMARILIDAGIHHFLIHRLMGNTGKTFTSFISGALFISYFLSMFFPNTIVLLSLIPIVKNVLESINDAELRNRLVTPIALALIYGANIGGMASLIGSPLNLVYVGYIEFNALPGRENITFFSWIIVGVPVTFILILVGRWLLRIKGFNSLITCSLENGYRSSNFKSSASISIEKVRFKKYLLFCAFNIGFIILMTAAQFFLKPQTIRFGINIIDGALLVYLVLFLFFSFIFPRSSGGKRSLQKYKKNFLFLISYIIMFPFIFFLETLREFCHRINKNQRKASKIEDFIDNFGHFLHKILDRIWLNFFKESFGRLKDKNNNAYVSINSLIYDLPFLGILFMAAVLGLVFLVLVIGDKPETTALDGYLVQFIEEIASKIVLWENQEIFLIWGIILVSIFLTEFINNTTVVLILFPVVMQVVLAMNSSPLFFLLAVSTAASGAFMTPIATSVNAVGYASIEGVSLKRMIKLGFIMNIISALWLTIFFYLLIHLTSI